MPPRGGAGIERGSLRITSSSRPNLTPDSATRCGPDGSLISTFAGGPYHVYAADFSPDGKWLLIAGKDRPLLGEALQNVLGDSDANKWVTAQLRDAANGEVLQTFEEHANDINDASFSPNGQWIVTASEDRTIDLWRRTTERQKP